MRWPWFALVILCPLLAPGQNLVAPADVPAVQALLRPSFLKKPLKCTNGHWSTRVDDGFRVKASYDASIPLNQYPAGTARRWTSVILIVADKDPGSAVYLTDSFSEDSENAEVSGNGQAALVHYRGYFWTGPGKFTVYETFVDSDGRGCKTRWRFSGSAAAAHLKLSLPEGAVAEASVRGLASDAGQQKSAAGASRVTVFLDVTPPPRGIPGFLAPEPRSADTLRLIAVLSDIARRIPASPLRLICFSLDRQQVLYQDQDFRGESLSSLQRLDDAISKMNFDTVDFKTLINRKGHRALLAQLINDEIRASPPPAAVIFMGYPERFEDNLTPDDVKTSAPQPKFFYLRPGVSGDDSITEAMRAVGGHAIPYTETPDLNRAFERIQEAISPTAH